MSFYLNLTPAFSPFVKSFDHSHRSSSVIIFWAGDEGDYPMCFICFGHGWEQYLHIISHNYDCILLTLVLAVDNEVISRISQGLMVLVGIGSGLCSLYDLYGFLPWVFSRIDDNDTDVSTLSKKMFVVQYIFFRNRSLGTFLIIRFMSSFYSLSLRVFADPSNPGKMWKSNVKDIDGDILCVSQFTLLANTTKGNKPDFHRAMVK